CQEGTPSGPGSRNGSVSTNGAISTTVNPKRARYQRSGKRPTAASPSEATRAVPAAGSVRSRATTTRATLSAASFQRGSSRRSKESGTGSCANARVISSEDRGQRTEDRSLHGQRFSSEAYSLIYGGAKSRSGRSC